MDEPEPSVVVPPEPVVRVWKSETALTVGAKPTTLWHWQYLDERGSLVASGGPTRDGLKSLVAVKKAVKRSLGKKYGKVRVELLVGEDDPDFKAW